MKTIDYSYTHVVCVACIRPWAICISR